MYDRKICFNSLLTNEVISLQNYTIGWMYETAYRKSGHNYIYANAFLHFLGSSSNTLSSGAIVTIITFVVIALIATP